MKNNRFCFALLFLIFIGSITSSFSQSLEFTKTPNGPVNFDLDVDVAKINLNVKNISSSPVKVWVTMDTSNISPSHRAYYCWEQCYSFGVVDARDIAGGKPLTLKPGQDTNAFIAYIDHYAVFNEPRAGISTLDFAFFNEDDPSDRITISLTFNVGNATSIDESAQAHEPLLYWNPPSKSINTASHLTDASIMLTSIDGSRRHYYSGLGSELANGIYGYVITEKSGKMHRGIISIIH